MPASWLQIARLIEGCTPNCSLPDHEKKFIAEITFDLPIQRQTATCHIGLSWEGEQACLALPWTFPSQWFSLGLINPILNFVVVPEATVMAVGQFPDAYQAGVAIPMVSVPKSFRCAAVGRPVIPEAIHDEFDPCSCICNKDQIKLIGIGFEESQCFLSHFLDTITSQHRRARI
jgi:hypothetical protein